jgi:hypothetical protein
MRSAKKTWRFSYNNGWLDWIEPLPVTARVEGEEGTFILLAGEERVRRAEERPVRRAIAAAMESRRRARGEILGSGTGTYEEEDGNVTIKFDPPGAETS